jgi:hypothetical protein
VWNTNPIFVVMATITLAKMPSTVSNTGKKAIAALIGTWRVAFADFVRGFGDA